MQGVYERHAVVFRSQHVHEPMPRSLSNGVVADGYRVKSRSNSYRGLLGRNSSKIIHISIDRKTADEELEIEQLSYEKIIDTYRSSGHSEEDKTDSGSAGSVPAFPRVEYEHRELLFGELPDMDSNSKRMSAFERGSTANGWISRPISVPSGRPTTAMSHVSSYDFESEMWTIDGTGCRTPSSAGEQRGFSGRGQRLASVQPTPVKPHKPTAAGASAHPASGTKEYIQFAHKMQVPKDFVPTKSRVQTKPDPPQPRIRSPTLPPADMQIRKGKIMTPPSVVPPPAPPASVRDMMTASPETDKRLPSIPLEEERSPSPPADLPPAVITLDVKYAFNIPTAELVAESETNSLADAEEFAVNVPIETELTDEELVERDIGDMATKLVDDVLSRLCNEGDDTWRSTTFLTADEWHETRRHRRCYFIRIAAMFDMALSLLLPISHAVSGFPTFTYLRKPPIV